MMERPWLVKTGRDPAGRLGISSKGVLAGALALSLLFMGFQGWWVLSPAPGVESASRIVEIPPNLGLMQIARRLDEAGVIRSPVGFVILTAARGSARALKAGEYEVPQGANTIAVLSLLEGGKVLRHPILFREGSTLVELSRLLEERRLAPAEDVLRLARDRHFLRTIEIPANSLEGYLFPDTYYFVRGMAPEEVLARMVARMREHLTADVLERARELDITLHQLLTLASIIEREAVDPSEMPLISAVFWNRLRREMPLQADPTVRYAVGNGWRALTRTDLQVDSPFNTYRRAGLPPGPIASPGKTAIRAAVNPARVGYLYFVSIDDRRHYFSTTLSDHNAAVARYRLTRGR